MHTRLTVVLSCTLSESTQCKCEQTSTTARLHAHNYVHNYSALCLCILLLLLLLSQQHLIASGLDYTILHPGGLVDQPGGKRELLLGVDDAFLATQDTRNVPREDVAEVSHLLPYYIIYNLYCIRSIYTCNSVAFSRAVVVVSSSVQRHCQHMWLQAQ
jgi:NAD(P)H-binding